MAQYQFDKMEGITVRYAPGKAEFSTRSMENVLSENTLSKKAWLAPDEFLDILHKLKHNQVAQNIVRKLFEDGFKAAPEKYRQEAYDFIDKSITESGDEFVDLETFLHPLSETMPHPNDPSDNLCNLWMAASFIFRGAVQGNEEGRKMANNTLFDYNPLKTLPDWDSFVPLKSEVLQVINDLHEGLQKKVDRAFSKDEK